MNFILPYIAHRIHGAGIYANIGGILMVNVTIYSIHGSYGLGIINPTDELIFFRGVGIPPTRSYMDHCLYHLVL